MKTITFIALLLLGLCASALAETSPAPGLLDPRIRSASYSAEQVYALKGFVGYQTDLQFENGEMFVGLGLGKFRNFLRAEEDQNDEENDENFRCADITKHTSLLCRNTCVVR